MVRVTMPPYRATPCWRWTTKFPGARSSKKPSTGRARARACRWGRRRPVTSDSASTATRDPGRTKPRSTGATTTRAPGAVRSDGPDGRSAATGTTTPSSARIPDRRSAPPAVDEHRTTEYPSSTRLETWPASLAPSPRIGLPAPALDLGDVRALGGGNQREHPGRGVGQQPVEGDVQAGGTGPGVESPGAGQGIGQCRLLVEQLTGPVPDAAGLDQDDQCVIAQQVGDELVGVGQPRQPRLHPVELVAVGQTVPLVAPPGRGSHQGRGPLAHGLVHHQLAASEQLDLAQVVDRTLIGHVEPGQPVDLVAPQVDPDRLVGGGREDVDDRRPVRPARRGARRSTRVDSPWPPACRPVRPRRSGPLWPPPPVGPPSATAPVAGALL